LFATVPLALDEEPDDVDVLELPQPASRLALTAPTVPMPQNFRKFRREISIDFPSPFFELSTDKILRFENVNTN
jgi:hypothetical protein